STSWRARASAIPSGSCSHFSVLPSMSVNSKVTMPVFTTRLLPTRAVSCDQMALGSPSIRGGSTGASQARRRPAAARPLCGGRLLRRAGRYEARSCRLRYRDCVTVNVLPAMSSVPLRKRSGPEKGATEKVSEPLPLPPPDPLTVIHGTLLTPVQAQPTGAVTATLPPPPPLPD